MTRSMTEHNRSRLRKRGFFKSRQSRTRAGCGHGNAGSFCLLAYNFRKTAHKRFRSIIDRHSRKAWQTPVRARRSHPVISAAFFIFSPLLSANLSSFLSAILTRGLPRATALPAESHCPARDTERSDCPAAQNFREKTGFWPLLSE